MKRTTKISIDEAKKKVLKLQEKGFSCEEQVMHWLVLEYLVDAVHNLQERCHTLENLAREDGRMP